MSLKELTFYLPHIPKFLPIPVTLNTHLIFQLVLIILIFTTAVLIQRVSIRGGRVTGYLLGLIYLAWEPIKVGVYKTPANNPLFPFDFKNPYYLGLFLQTIAILFLLFFFIHYLYYHFIVFSGDYQVRNHNTRVRRQQLQHEQARLKQQQQAQKEQQQGSSKPSLVDQIKEKAKQIKEKRDQPPEDDISNFL